MRFRTLALLALASTASAGPYIFNAFTITTAEGQPLLTNRDLECVSIDKNSATFALNPTASHVLREFTLRNPGVQLALSVCGEPSAGPTIQGVVAGGKFTHGPLNARQLKCLRDSFKTRKVCRDCPVCKN